MNIKFTFFALVFSLMGITIAQSQIINYNVSQTLSPNVIPDPNPNKLGTCAATCVPISVPTNNTNENPKGGGNNSTMNGNGTLGTTYVATECGLNYVLGKVKLGKRLPQPGVNQPAAIAIAGLPVCRIILKAYLYTGGSGNGIAFNATVQNPAAGSAVVPMTMIGQHVDKCWGYNGTYNYRGDITALITGNGNYLVSGIPTNPPVAGNDMDGASIVIVYRDLTQTYTGHIVIADGCRVGIGGTMQNNVTGWNACAASTFANAFMIVSDLQNVGVANCFMNSLVANFPYASASQDWWDNIVMSPIPAITAGQNSAGFGLSSGGDCYNIAVEGLYYRTACTVCTPPTLTITTAVTSTCAVGSATAFVSGGSPPYTYTWTPSAASSSAITNVPSGNYTVVAKDATGCLTVSAVVVIPLSSTTLAVNSGTICVGNSITLTANGGNTYTWTPSATLSSPNGNPVVATPITSTNYTVTGTNASGCTGTAVASVVVNPLPVVAPTNTGPYCAGATINLSVGAAASYTWTGPNTFNSNLQNPTIANSTTLNAGTYTVKVTSAAGCIGTGTTLVVVNPIQVVLPTNTGPYCVGATINLSVGAAATYTWSGPNAFTSNAQNPTVANCTTLNAGVYTVSVTSAAGCTGTGTTQVVVNPLPTATITSNSPVCSGNPINLSVNANTSYTWAGPNGFTSNAQSPTIASAVLANGGNYSVTVTNGFGCTTTSVIAVVVNPTPTITINPNPAVICLGNSINLTASGATAYTWTPATALNTNIGANVIATPIIQTTYTVLGSALNCTNTGVITVSVLGLPSVTVTPSSPTICMNNFNGSPNTVTLNATGAASYTWGPIIGLTTNTLNGSSVIGTSNGAPVATGTVIGANGSCTNIATFTINAIPNPIIAVTSGSMCAGKSVTLSASGANTFTWSPSATLNTANGSPVIASPAVTTVYSVIGSSVGCNSQTQTGTATVVVNPTVTVLPNPAVICLGNSINLTASGATAYTWTPATALTSTNTANTTANPLVTTTYSVLGSQATCTNISVITVTVLGLPSVTVTPSSPTLCMNNFNGSPNTVTLNATGAASYTWGPITGLTTNTLNGASIIGTSNGAPVATGTVIGANGTCTNMATFTVNAIPNPIIAVTSGSMCFGTSVNLSSSGANTYTWSPSASLNTANGNAVIASPSITTVYSVIGSSVGCNSQTQTGIATVISNPTVTSMPNPAVICFGNSINLMAVGATAYTWTPATALNTTTGPNVIANPTITTTYSVIGSQATCTNVTAITVTVLGLPVITITPSSPTLCMNNFNGSPNTVTLNATGAASYTWGPITGLTTNTLNGSSIVGTSNGAPVATGTVIGANGTCTNTATFTVNAIPNPIIAVTSGSMCFGTSVNLTSSGANTYTWSPSATLNTANGNAVTASPSVTTVYSVIGSSVGCQSQTQNGTANVVPNPTPSIAPLTPTICIGSSINLTASGATDYTWTPANTLNTNIGANVIANPTITTTYTVIGSQATCTNIAIRTVTVVNLPIINIATSSPTLCMNNFNGSPNTINLTASGASSYTWTGFVGLNPSALNGSSIVGMSILQSPIGTGSVIGMLATCTNVATFSVAAIPNPIISVTSASMCFGTSAILNASGADTFVWSPAATLNSSTGSSVIASPNVNTVYSVIGSSLGCNSITETGTVAVVPNPTITVAPLNPTICAGQSVGLTASGATSYTWIPANSVDNPNNASVIASPNITTLYTVIGSMNSCTSTAVRQVSVIPLPTLQAICEKSVICIGDKTTINANGANSYTWSPSTGITDPFSNFIIAQPTESTIYSLIGNNGACTATLMVPIVVLPKPILIISTSNQKICEGANTTIFASGAQTYSWSPDTNMNHISNNAVVVNPSQSTNYTISAVNATGSVSCLMTQEILIDVVPHITVTVSNSVTICEGESTHLISGGRNTFNWTPSAGLSNSLISSPYANPSITTIYTVYVSDGGFCASTGTVLVKVNPKPEVEAGPDQIINVDEPMYLNAKGTGTLTWTFGEAILCKVCPNTQIMPQNSGDYIVEAVDKLGCKAEDRLHVEVTRDHSVYIPNIFTPNFDGNNDVFLVYGTGISDVEMYIFDRWGEKLYTSMDQLKGWDGTYKGVLSKNDVYVYLVKYTSLDGKKHTRTGHVSLLK